MYWLLYEMYWCYKVVFYIIENEVRKYGNQIYIVVYWNLGNYLFQVRDVSLYIVVNIGYNIFMLDDDFFRVICRVGSILQVGYIVKAYLMWYLFGRCVC